MILFLALMTYFVSNLVDPVQDADLPKNKRKKKVFKIMIISDSIKKTVSLFHSVN